MLLLLIPISVYVVSKQQTLQTENLKYKDIRIRLYSEILNGIKVQQTEMSGNNSMCRLGRKSERILAVRRDSLVRILAFIMNS